MCLPLHSSWLVTAPSSDVVLLVCVKTRRVPHSSVKLLAFIPIMQNILHTSWVRFFSLSDFLVLLPHFYLTCFTHPLWTALPHSGLNLAPVARLRSSWEKLPSKYEKLFGDLQDVFDPSRNMAKYRNILSSQSMQPPIIPLFPVVKKDLTFLHEGGHKTLLL